MRYESKNDTITDQENKPKKVRCGLPKKFHTFPVIGLGELL